MSDTPTEVSLEDIDKLLESEDPDFAKSLEEVRSVEVDSSVEIEASAIDDSLSGEEMETAQQAAESAEGLGFIAKTKLKISTRVRSLRQKAKASFLKFIADTLIFLKTRPKEFALYSLAILRRTVVAIKRPIKAFQEAPRVYQAGVIIFISVVSLAVGVFFANLKGIWIPHLMEPLLTNLADHAEYVETYDPKGDMTNFHAAFPQDRHEFLFKKFKVNLRRTPDHPNPMGAFEIIVEGDSKDTAIELSDREVEFHDLLQRLFEEESYSDLVSGLGKERVKGRIKRDLNAKLTQGWIREVNFKMFILKP